MHTYSFFFCKWKIYCNLCIHLILIALFFVSSTDNCMMGVRLWALLLALVGSVMGQCPWQRDMKELQSACICAYNLGHELSVQCDVVEFPLLLTALNKHVRGIALDLLYVNNSTVYELTDGIFKNFKIHNIQLSGCRIRDIAPGAFRGQEESLKNLNLQVSHTTVWNIVGNIWVNGYDRILVKGRERFKSSNGLLNTVVRSPL